MTKEKDQEVVRSELNMNEYIMYLVKINLHIVWVENFDSKEQYKPLHKSNAGKNQIEYFELF